MSANGSIASVSGCSRGVCFTPNSGHLLLTTNSRPIMWLPSSSYQSEFVPSNKCSGAPHTPQLRLVAFVGSSRLSGPLERPAWRPSLRDRGRRLFSLRRRPHFRVRCEVGYGADLGGVSGAANVSWQPPPADQITRQSTACHLPRSLLKIRSYSTVWPGINSLQPSRFFACIKTSRSPGDSMKP